MEKYFNAILAENVSSAEDLRLVVIGKAHNRISKRLHSRQRKAKIAQTSPQPMDE